MTYIELINRFWESYRLKKFSDIDTAIYFFLLNECNIRRWLNPFELQTRNLEISLSISRKTIGEARNRLRQRGMIDFIEAQGRGATVYLIDGVDVTNKELKSRFCVSSTKHKGNTNGNTKVTQGLHKGNTKANPTLLDEDIRYKTKDNIPISPDKPGEGVLDFELDEPKKKKSKSRTPQESPPAPTLEEVKAYFLSQSADTRLDDWETEAEIFFNNFDATDWVDASGRKIKRWDSRANRWILEKEQRKKSHHVTTPTTRPDTAADERRQRQDDIASYVAHNIGNNTDHPGGSGTDMPI